jgi:hypothetical protein
MLRKILSFEPFTESEGAPGKNRLPPDIIEHTAAYEEQRRQV